jgi:uncharacterized membrane protein
VTSWSKFLIVSALIAILVIVSIFLLPALNLLGIPKNEETFSELWLLGPEHKAENYPFNVSVNEDYTLYVGVGNQLGESSDYAVYVKLSNQTQQLANSTTAEPSPLPSLHEYLFALQDEELWEIQFTFAIDYVLLQQNVTRVKTLSINGNMFPVDCTSIWDSDKNGFYCQLVFELWCYNKTSSSFQYHNRDARLWLNMTSS